MSMSDWRTPFIGRAGIGCYAISSYKDTLLCRTAVLCMLDHLSFASAAHALSSSALPTSASADVVMRHVYGALLVAMLFVW